MHIRAVDAYLPGASLVHRLDARVKLVLTVLFVVSGALTPDGAWLTYGLLTALTLGVVMASGVSVALVQRRAAVALPFALSAVTIMFAAPGRPLWAIWVFGRELTLTDRGLVRFVSILLKSWLSVQMAVVLTASTSFPELLQAMRSLSLPKVLVAIAGFAYRYLFVIGDEALRMMRARAARSGSLDGQQGTGTVVWRARVAGRMVGSLFVRSIERSERIYDAMVARGYDGEVRTLGSPTLRPRDLLTALSFALILWGLQVLARLPR